MPLSRCRTPLLVGEDNPYGGDPEFALYPAPEGCAGWRLCCVILGLRRINYLRYFERVNLCGDRWSAPEARLKAVSLAGQLRPTIMLGSKVAAAFGLPFRPYEVVAPQTVSLPHPSGRCRLWNEPSAVNRARAAVVGIVPYLECVLGEADE